MVVALCLPSSSRGLVGPLVAIPPPSRASCSFIFRVFPCPFLPPVFEIKSPYFLFPLFAGEWLPTRKYFFFPLSP